MAFTASGRMRLLASSLFASFVMHSTAGHTDDSDLGRSTETQLEPVSILGHRDQQDSLPGAGTYIDRSATTEQGYLDIHRVLRQIPGVYIREEDGYGLFPNISLRGVDPGRSAKLTLMEDGVLTAPAPYSSPSAYFSPNIGRMSGLEVLKGSSQIQYGPHTTGGVINYLSTSIPSSRNSFARIAYGTDNDRRTHVWFGDTVNMGNGRAGFLVELNHRETDGFKSLDAPHTQVGPDARETGFERTEPMVKLMWEPATETYQRFVFKHGRTRLNANETYLGLSEDDFADNPHRRYAGSRFDNIQTEHERTYLRHYWQLNPAMDLTSTAYRATFHRNWFKIFGVDAGNGRVSLGSALASDDNGDTLEVLRGNASGDLFYRNNNRRYYLQGLETKLVARLKTRQVLHSISTGLRLHEDEVLRFQNNEIFSQDGSGDITGHTINPPGSQDDRTRRTKALAWFVEDRMQIGRLTLSPGVRIERLDWTFEDRRSGNLQARDGKTTLVSGGIGANWRTSNHLSLFGGVYRGVSPPNPQAGTSPNNPQREETSLSSELGARYRAASGLVVETTAFATRFDDLVVNDNLGASGSGDGGAVGRVDSYGLEFSLNHDLSSFLGWTAQVPTRLTTTFTRAEIANDSTSADAESIFSGGTEGNELPYIPQWQVNYSIGINRQPWQLNAQVNWIDETFGSASNTSQQVAPDGSRDARFGSVDRVFTVDLSAAWNVNRDMKFFANIHNLFDDEYIASRLPEGPRPGAPLSAVAGIEWALQ